MDMSRCKSLAGNMVAIGTAEKKRGKNTTLMWELSITLIKFG